MTGLYVHIPFCTKKCHYCDFVITKSGSLKKHDDFLSALEIEVKHYAAEFEPRVFDTLYLGGGTPSTMRVAEIVRLFMLLRKNFKFAQGAEITCEVNPGDIDPEKARLLRSLGINRISLGAQSFQDETLKRLNRAHSARDIFTSFQILKDAGFKNINLDLILSLPGETLADVENSLKQALSLDPSHVSLYELVIEERTVFGRQFKRGSLSLPEEGTQLEMLSFARQYLKDHGLEHYELLNYAEPGFESRHNLLYWANEEYLGLGPGAFSYFNGRRFRNSTTYEEYLDKISRHDWAAAEEDTLTADKKAIESLLLALRLTEGAELNRFGSVVQKLEESVMNLEEKGLLVRDTQKMRLTPRGQFLAETVFTELSA